MKRLTTFASAVAFGVVAGLSVAPLSAQDAELQFAYNDNSMKFTIVAYQDVHLFCRPRVKRGEMPPRHRFPDYAEPSEYTQPSYIETEDDVLHVRHLPDFNGNLRPADAEVLLQVSRDSFTVRRRADCHHAPR